MEELYKKLTFTKYKKEKGACSVCEGKGTYYNLTCETCNGTGKGYKTLKAGDVIKLKHGSIKFVGDVNIHLGTCDDCVCCNPRDIVEIANISQLFK
jgi:DnaJ-class molecular chaperone